MQKLSCLVILFWVSGCSQSEKHSETVGDVKLKQEVQVVDNLEQEAESEAGDEIIVELSSLPTDQSNQPASPLDPYVISLVNSVIPTEQEINIETIEELEKESSGTYRSTQQRLKACQALPIAAVWREFAPFFKYKWNDDFQDFAALFLAIWEKETGFTYPKKGVVVNANCKNKLAKTVTSLRGKNIKSDFAASLKKDKILAKHFKGCNLNLADYGSLQWNHHWRLSRTAYRKHIERALLLSSSYKPKELRKLSNKKLASLVKFNSRALFILGGLSLREGAKTPIRTIAEYNTGKSYRKKVGKRTREIAQMLEHPSCAPAQVEKKKGKKRHRKSG